MKRTRMAFLISLSAMALSLGLLAGCGGSSSDDGASDSGASKADTQELTALAGQVNQISQEKDAKGFCAILAPSQIDSTFHSRSKCTTEYTKIFANIKSPPSVTLDSISVDGDTANLTFKESDTPVTFIKEQGKWWLSGEQSGSTANSADDSSTGPGGGTKPKVIK